MITLTIPMATPSLNVVTGRHWRHYWRQRKLWRQLVWVAKAQAGIHGDPLFQRASVRIVRYGANLLDEDNLRGGMKPVIDAIKALGLIVDDSPQHITLVTEQWLSKEKKTVIQVAQMFPVEH